MNSTKSKSHSFENIKANTPSGCKDIQVRSVQFLFPNLDKGKTESIRGHLTVDSWQYL